MKNKFKFWIILSFIIVFAAGIIAGIFSEKYLISKRLGRMREIPVHFPSLEMMAQELSLSPQQKEQIREVFKNNEERLKGLRSQMHDRLSEIRSQLKTEIENILTPEQRQKFEAMIEKYIGQRKKELEDREKHSRHKEKEDKKGERK
jgi:Spy/CpxP family protein refolding chaperone